MGWRFRKYIHIAPGVKLNLSKGGVSTTFGGKGASVNMSKNGTYVNTSIPGTGLYRRDKLFSKKKKMSTKAKNNSHNDMKGCLINGWGFYSLFMVIGAVVLLVKGDIKLEKDYLLGFIFFLLSTIFVFWKKIFSIFEVKEVQEESELQGGNVSESKPKKEQLKDLAAQITNFDINSIGENNSKLDIDNSKSTKNDDIQDISSILLPSGEKLDPLFYDAAKLVVHNQSASRSLIQKKFTIGFNRGSRLIEQLEICGIITKPNESKVREVLIKDEPSLIQLISDLRNKSKDNNNDYRAIEDKDVISQTLFNEVNANIDMFSELILELRANITFMANYKNSEAKIPDILNLLIIKDIITCFRDLGHTLAIDTIEGQCVMQTYINLGVKKDKTYQDFKSMLILNTTDRIKARELLQDALCEIEESKMIMHEGELNLVSILKYDKDLVGKYLTLLYRFMVMIVKSDNSITEKETIWLNELIKLRENLVDSSSRRERNKVYEGKSSSKESVANVNLNHTEELAQLIGLENVKTEVKNLYNLVKVQKMRETSGMKTSNVSYHCVFTGNPGTGKTTVARIVAEIYKDLGVVKKGHLVETDRSGLVGEYVGQTAPKTNAIIDSALDGVLFIDEAYSLVQGGQGDYGKEAISTLLKRMEDDRDRLVVILAGYSKEMEDFINSNSGLQSRFNRYIEFPDYTSSELLQIFNSLAKKSDYNLSQEAEKKVASIIEDALRSKDSNFGNARYVRNLFEKIVTQQANRIISASEITNEMLAKIEVIDVINTQR